MSRPKRAKDGMDMAHHVIAADISNGPELFALFADMTYHRSRLNVMFPYQPCQA